MVKALQRPLFQDGYSGVVDPGRIAGILRDLLHRLMRLRVSLGGDPVLYDAYGSRVDHSAGILVMESPSGTTSPRAVAGCRVVVSFAHGGRDYFFQSRLRHARAGHFHTDFPLSLQRYPRREGCRTQTPPPSPVVVEFQETPAARERRVYEVEDLGSRGLSFRVPGENVPPPPGTEIASLELYSRDTLCYSSAAGVQYATRCRTLSGEEYVRVGVVLLRQGAHGRLLPPFLKQGEAEEIRGDSEIQKCLSEVSRYRIEVDLQDEAGSNPPARVLLTEIPDEAGRLVRLASGSGGGCSFRFFRGQRVQVQYLLFGTRYCFVTVVRSVLADGIVVERPASIIWTRRRRTLRCKIPRRKWLRLVFQHPFLEKRVVGKILDLSEQGVSISTDARRALLFEGLRIGAAGLGTEDQTYPVGRLCIQSVSSPSLRGGGPRHRVGMIFRSLPEQTRGFIRSTLEKEHRPQLARPAVQVIPAIWEHFRESGFLYAEKQAGIQKHLAEIQRTWRKLHHPQTRFFRDLIFLRDDKVLGTAAILQGFENTWVLQHLSALKDPAAFVSKEVNLGIAEELILNPEVLYLKIYFRAENPWPNKNFRTFAERRLPRRLYDLTLYRFYRKDISPVSTPGFIRRDLQVEPMRKEDREVIRNYFIRRGKVLFARSEALFGNDMSLPRTARRYRERGLRRSRRIFVARRGPLVVSFAVAEDASYGVNLSELLNTFRIHHVGGDQEDRTYASFLLVNHALAFYRSLGYETVTLATGDAEDGLPARWGFSHYHDYYCLTMHRDSLFYYLYHIREKYGKVECRILRRIK